MSIEQWNIDSGWTLFLDRDGVINERIWGGYVTTVEEFRFCPGALEAINGFSAVFGRIIVVTNQQGISKGIMTEGNLLEVHTYMCQTVKEAGGRIDRCYFASNLAGTFPDRRKPNGAMGREAKADFPEIDFQRAVMVGDAATDLRFGKDLGMKTVLVKSAEEVDEMADLTVDSLLNFWQLMK